MDDDGIRYVDVGGVRIAHWRVGRGAPVLMTHGYTASAHMFAGNARALASDHTVITWDLRGHGASDSPEDASAYTADLAVADMAAVLDANDVERAVVVGHSLGGYLSLAFRLAQPARVRALVLIGTGPGYRNAAARESWNAMAVQYAEQLERHGFAGFRGGEEFSADVHRSGPAGLALAARGILVQSDARVLESLPSIDVPTFVVVGEHDEPFLNSSRYLAAKIPGAELVVIRGAGHAPNVTHHETFDAALRTFLDRIPA